MPTSGQFRKECFVIARAAEVEKHRSEANSGDRVDCRELLEGSSSDVITRDLTLAGFLEFALNAIDQASDRFGGDRSLHASVFPTS